MPTGTRCTTARNAVGRGARFATIAPSAPHTNTISAPPAASSGRRLPGRSPEPRGCPSRSSGGLGKERRPARPRGMVRPGIERFGGSRCEWHDVIVEQACTGPPTDGRVWVVWTISSGPCPAVAGRGLPSDVRESMGPALCNIGPSAGGSSTDPRSVRRERRPSEQSRARSPPRTGGLGPGTLSAGPEPTVVDTSGPVSAGPPAVGLARKLGRSLTARAVGIVGVAALVVVGSLVGSAVLSSSGSSPRSTNIRTVLTAAHDASTASSPTITVTGTGEVEGTPDTATFGVGVSTTEPTAVEALQKNNAQVATLEQSLEHSGVPLKDMQTSWLNLSANTNSKGVVRSFSADDELTVTMNDLADLGASSGCCRQRGRQRRHVGRDLLLHLESVEVARRGKGAGDAGGEHRGDPGCRGRRIDPRPDRLDHRSGERRPIRVLQRGRPGEQRRRGAGASGSTADLGSGDGRLPARLFLRGPLTALAVQAPTVSMPVRRRGSRHRGRPGSPPIVWATCWTRRSEYSPGTMRTRNRLLVALKGRHGRA